MPLCRERVRERKRERESERVRERQRGRDRDREKVCVYVYACAFRVFVFVQNGFWIVRARSGRHGKLRRQEEGACLGNAEWLPGERGVAKERRYIDR